MLNEYYLPKIWVARRWDTFLMQPVLPASLRRSLTTSMRKILVPAAQFWIRSKVNSVVSWHCYKFDVIVLTIASNSYVYARSTAR